MGHHNIRYTGDAHAASGIWGYPDSKANFCEEDYAITSYIAEFISTISNAAYVYYALRYCRKTRPGAPWYEKIDFMAIALISVGVCSTAFHGTMRQIPQLFDDMSMNLLAGALLQPLYAQNQSPAVRNLVTAVVILGVGAISAAYLYTGDIFIHATAYLCMITIMWPRALYLVYRMGRSDEEKRKLMTSFKRAAWTLGLGYTLWHVDLEFCLNLRAAREVVGLPLAWILELHGWWHILTAMGASHFIRLIRMVTEEQPGRRKEHQN